MVTADLVPVLEQPTLSLLRYSAMDIENEPQHRRIPTLVQLCQRAAIANTDAIYNLGDLSYSLVKPILDRCTTEQLLRFEQFSPHLEKDTSEIWRDLCFRVFYLTAVKRFSLEDVPQEPDTWRSRYFVLQELEAKRMDEIGSKIRTQRQEADERKKEKEVKLTDRVPPAKRPRNGGWNTISQPKTLFQKTRCEASKIQRARNARILPSMPTAKNFRISPPVAPASGSAPPLAVSSSSRVSVNTIAVHRPQSSTAPSSSAPTKTSVISLTEKSTSLLPGKVPITMPVVPASSPGKSTATPMMSVSPAPESLRSPPKLRTSAKKDPMTSLFVPKRKTHTQRPA